MDGWNGMERYPDARGTPRRGRGRPRFGLRFFCASSTRLVSTRLDSLRRSRSGEGGRTEPNRTARWLRARGFGIEANRTIERCVEGTRARRIVDDGGRFYIFIRAHGSVGDDGDGGEEPGGRERAR